MTTDDELLQLRASLSALYGSMLRMFCKTPGVIHLKAQDWYAAFAPLQVPPYKRLRWEQEDAKSPPVSRDEYMADLVEKVSRYERALQDIANEETDDLFQDVALGCTCSEFHKTKMMFDPACPFHMDHG